MHLFTKKTIQEYCQKYSDAKSSLQCWAKDVKDANWKSPHEVKKYNQTASLIGSNRVVFNI